MVIEQKDADRFWKYVQFNFDENGCWMWTGGKFAKGYGSFKLKNVARYAQRVSWELFFGKIPEGMSVCHHCNNPSCVRPDHLFIGTNYDNVMDSLKKGRRIMPYGIILNAELVKEIRASSEAISMLSKRMNISRDLIRHVKKYNCWKHI